MERNISSELTEVEPKVQKIELKLNPVFNKAKIGSASVASEEILLQEHEVPLFVIFPCSTQILITGHMLL
jgi:hypothetical protein